MTVLAPEPVEVAATPDQAYTATLRITPPRAHIGETVEITGSGYPAGARVELVWYTVQGRYELLGGTEFVGQTYDDFFGVLGSAVASADGDIRMSVVVPTDFGGAHDVRARLDGQEVSQASLSIQPTIFLVPEEGPVGTPVELHVVGVDCRPSLNTWHVLYDNRYLGQASAVTTRGVAVARFRATGPVGPHVIGAWNNSFNNTPYLAWDTGPFRDIVGPGTELVFRTTADPGPSDPSVDDFAATDRPWASLTRGPAHLELSVDRGTPGTLTTLIASGLPAGEQVELLWWTTVGNRITAGGYEEHAEPLASVRTDGHGVLTWEFPIPDDLGGHHRIDAAIDGQAFGSVGLVILPRLVAFEPRRVHAGERLALHIKGLGWTTFDNTYTVTYDNAHIGYVCGFSTNGDVRFSVTAVGAPGTHLIDLYPTIYRSTDPARMPRGVYSVPQLTYADDHPGRRTPAFHLSFEIVP
ncbi:MAG TPA: hypothetical protein VF937_00505 [Chloroflexota bacterium]